MSPEPDTLVRSGRPVLITPAQRAAAARRLRTHPEVRRIRLRREIDLGVILLAEIARTGAIVASAREEVARSAGLTRARWALLEALSRTDYAWGMADVAQRIHLSRQAVRRLAIELERAGLLEFCCHAGDRRAIQLLLTPRGREALD